MPYSNIRKFGLNNPLNQSIRLRIDGRGGFVQEKDLAPSSQRSHERNWVSAVLGQSRSVLTQLPLAGAEVGPLIRHDSVETELLFQGSRGR